MGSFQIAIWRDVNWNPYQQKWLNLHESASYFI